MTEERSQATPEELIAALETANRQLREERRIFVEGPVVVFKWRNAEGWPVEYVSPNVAEVFGYTAAEFLDGDVLYGDLIHADDVARVIAEVRVATEGTAGQFEHVPYRVVEKGGAVVWLHDFTTILRDEEGAATHYLGYVLDITAQKQAEEERAALRAQVLHTQKLESLGLLAGGVAHDFNNILTGVLANAGLARKAAEQGSEVDVCLESIESAASCAADLCTQMLAYSGRGRFVVEAYDLGDVLRELSPLLEAACPENVRLTYDLAAALPAVEVDVTQLRQVLLNLVTNAAESIGGSAGDVRLRTGLRPAVPDEPEHVFAQVIDTGSGMDAATLARIFDPFYTTKRTGRGLGLAAAQGILRGLGGSLRFESDPGRGTTAELRLPPSARAPKAPPAPARDHEEWTGHGTLLLVDDEAVIRDAGARVLQRAGFEVLTAADGREGLRVAQETPRVDLILLDLTMPVLGGVRALHELRRRGNETRVLMMSGFNGEDVALRCGEVKPTGFLQKPFLPTQLIGAVRQALSPAADHGPRPPTPREATPAQPPPSPSESSPK